MIIRYRIRKGADVIKNLSSNEAFRLDGVHYPANWIAFGGKIPGYNIQEYDATPPPPPPATRWRLRYLRVLDRVSNDNANAIDAAVELLPAKVRVRINTAGVWSDDTSFRNLLEQVGVDPDLVLAQ